MLDLAFGLVFSLSGAAASSREEACNRASRSGEPAYSVKGSLYFSDGGGSGYRLRVSGTGRRLWVTTKVDPVLPVGMSAQLSSFDQELEGRWTLVPIQKDKPGAMREVCLVSATHLGVKRRRQNKDPRE